MRAGERRHLGKHPCGQPSALKARADLGRQSTQRRVSLTSLIGVERGLDHGIDPLAQTLVAPVPRAGRGIALCEHLAGGLVVEDELKPSNS